MNYLSAIVLLYFTITIGSITVDGLQCYTCLYFPSFNESEPSCRKDPIANLSFNCDNTLGPNDIEMCVTMIGVVDEKPIVGRGCIAYDREMDGKCANYDYLPIGPINRNGTKVNMCYCSKDNCNNANAASHLQHTYIPLFAFAVYLWHKFV